MRILVRVSWTVTAPWLAGCWQVWGVRPRAAGHRRAHAAHCGTASSPLTRPDLQPPPAGHTSALPGELGEGHRGQRLSHRSSNSSLSLSRQLRTAGDRPGEARAGPADEAGPVTGRRGSDPTPSPSLWPAAAPWTERPHAANCACLGRRDVSPDGHFPLKAAGRAPRRTEPAFAEPSVASQSLGRAPWSLRWAALESTARAPKQGSDKNVSSKR